MNASMSATLQNCGLGPQREISVLNSGVTARSRFRVGFNPHRPAIARIRGSPLHSRTLRPVRRPPRRLRPSSGAPKIAASSLHIERADPATSFLQAPARPCRRSFDAEPRKKRRIADPDADQALRNHKQLRPALRWSSRWPQLREAEPTEPAGT